MRTRRRPAASGHGPGPHPDRALTASRLPSSAAELLALFRDSELVSLLREFLAGVFTEDVASTVRTALEALLGTVYDVLDSEGILAMLGDGLPARDDLIATFTDAYDQFVSALADQEAFESMFSQAVDTLEQALLMAGPSASSLLGRK